MIEDTTDCAQAYLQHGHYRGVYDDLKSDGYVRNEHPLHLLLRRKQDPCVCINVSLVIL